jgi:hypothetical protein
MKFARIVFRIAGIYGILVMFPQYFMEQKTGSDYPPAITHVEYYYSFIGVVLVFQLLFFLIASDPERYRSVMLIGVLEKLSLVPTFLLLFFQNRFPQHWIAPVCIDLVFAALFVASHVKAKKPAAGAPH